MANIIEGNLKADGKKFAIIVARFNSFISEKLLEGALDTLDAFGRPGIGYRCRQGARGL